MSVCVLQFFAALVEFVFVLVGPVMSFVPFVIRFLLRVSWLVLMVKYSNRNV
jgi:hypothetical protein